jgi:hypothetical protein
VSIICTHLHLKRREKGERREERGEGERRVKENVKSNICVIICGYGSL